MNISGLSLRRLSRIQTNSAATVNCPKNAQLLISKHSTKLWKCEDPIRTEEGILMLQTLDPNPSSETMHLKFSTQMVWHQRLYGVKAGSCAIAMNGKQVHSMCLQTTTVLEAFAQSTTLAWQVCTRIFCPPWELQKKFSYCKTSELFVVKIISIEEDCEQPTSPKLW